MTYAEYLALIKAIKEGLPYAAAAKAFGLSPRGVKRLAEDAGVARPTDHSKNWRSATAREKTVERNREILRLFEAGMTWDRLAIKFGLSINTIKITVQKERRSRE